jgi:hypothetical protein
MIKAIKSLNADTPKSESTVDKSIPLTTENANNPTRGMRIIENPAIKCLEERLREKW